MGYLYLCVSTGLQTRPQRQRVTAKARLRNGHTLRGGGDKSGDDAAFRQNSLTTCYLLSRH